MEALKSAAAQGNGSGSDEAEDLNKLPKPTEQKIDKEQGYIEWSWGCGSTDYKVVSSLNTVTGEYYVTIQRVVTSAQTPGVFGMSGDDAKIVGQALVSAWNWQEIWQMHAGEFIAREMGIGNLIGLKDEEYEEDEMGG